MSNYIDRVSGLASLPEGDWSGRWYFEGEHVLSSTENLGGANDDEESDHQEAFNRVAPDLIQLTKGGLWESFLQVPLLDTSVDADTGLRPQERTLHRHLGSLQFICNKEYLTRIGEIHEILPVGRVRKPARRALNRLASHTEDWAGRNFEGPIPRKALAVLREEDADLYENRMVTELIHPILTSKLQRRLRGLAKLQANLAELEQNAEGTYRRIRRLCEFWGSDSEKARQASEQVARTIEVLDGLLLQLQKLRGSALYSLVGGRKTGSRFLRRTNVVRGNRHYFAAGSVWQAFAQEPKPDVTEQERLDRVKHQHRQFDWYSLAFIIRALEGLGYTPTDQSSELSFESPGVVELRGPWGQCHIETENTGAIVLKSHAVSTRFVPLMNLFSEKDTPEMKVERWNSISSVAKKQTVVIYLSSTDIVKGLESEEASVLISAGRDSIVSFKRARAVPISPLEISSLERISRAVALAVQMPALLDYPVPIELTNGKVSQQMVSDLESAIKKDARLSPLFHMPNEGGVNLRRPFSSGELSQMEAMFERELKYSSPLGRQRDKQDSLGRLREAIHEARKKIDLLMKCPICGDVADLVNVRYEKDLMSVTCRDGHRWGHERCGNCQGRIAIIEPDTNVKSPKVTGPGWVERILGRDALSSPCWARVPELRYICEQCGTCPNQNSKEADSCSRCRF